jgi:hypothetical protein
MDKEDFLYMSSCKAEVFHRSHRINKVNKQMCQRIEIQKKEKRNEVFLLK